MNLKFSFIITSLAGLSTLLGTIPIFFKIKNINKFIVSSLSFAAGVMFFVSTFDLLIESLKLFSDNYNPLTSVTLFLILFLGGVLLSKLVNSIPESNALYKIGVVSMFTIILHNIPEGILTFVASNVNQKLGMSLALAVAMHNIPEGISIAVPIFLSTGSRKKALLFTFVSALSEPIGALIAYLFLKNIMDGVLLAVLFSLVCGIMIYLSLFELLKEAKKYHEEQLLNIFFIIGMLFMFIALKI